MKTSTDHNPIVSTLALTLIPSATLLRRFLLQRHRLHYSMLKSAMSLFSSVNPFLWSSCTGIDFDLMWLSYLPATFILNHLLLPKSKIWHTCWNTHAQFLSFLPVSHFASRTVSFQLSCYRVAVLNNSVSWLKTVKYKHRKSTRYARHLFISYGA